MYFILEFTTSSQLSVFSNFIQRVNAQTRYKSFCFQVTYDGAVSVTAKRTPENVKNSIKTAAFQMYAGDTLILDNSMYPVPSHVQQP